MPRGTLFRQEEIEAIHTFVCDKDNYCVLAGKAGAERSAKFHEMSLFIYNSLPEFERGMYPRNKSNLRVKFEKFNSDFKMVYGLTSGYGSSASDSNENGNSGRERYGPNGKFSSLLAYQESLFPHYKNWEKAYAKFCGVSNSKGTQGSMNATSIPKNGSAGSNSTLVAATESRPNNSANSNSEYDSNDRRTNLHGCSRNVPRTEQSQIDRASTESGEKQLGSRLSAPPNSSNPRLEPGSFGDSDDLVSRKRKRGSYNRLSRSPLIDRGNNPRRGGELVRVKLPQYNTASGEIVRKRARVEEVDAKFAEEQREIEKERLAIEKRILAIEEEKLEIARKELAIEERKAATAEENLAVEKKRLAVEKEKAAALTSQANYQRSRIVQQRNATLHKLYPQVLSAIKVLSPEEQCNTLIGIVEAFAAPNP